MIKFYYSIFLKFYKYNKLYYLFINLVKIYNINMISLGIKS